MVKVSKRRTGDRGLFSGRIFDPIERAEEVPLSAMV